MFDLTSSKLLLLAIVALLVIGPKDFPVLLRTIGKYMGIIRGHAKEFRAQFDEALRESELAQLKKDMESIGQQTEAALNATKQSVEQTFADARQSVETSVETSVDATQSKADAPPAAESLAAAAAPTESAPAEVQGAVAQGAEVQGPEVQAPVQAPVEGADGQPPAAPQPAAPPAGTAATAATERAGA